MLPLSAAGCCKSSNRRSSATRFGSMKVGSSPTANSCPWTRTYISDQAKHTRQWKLFLPTLIISSRWITFSSASCAVNMNEIGVPTCNTLLRTLVKAYSTDGQNQASVKVDTYLWRLVISVVLRRPDVHWTCRKKLIAEQGRKFKIHTDNVTDVIPRLLREKKNQIHSWYEKLQIHLDICVFALLFR